MVGLKVSWTNSIISELLSTYTSPEDLQVLALVLAGKKGYSCPVVLKYQGQLWQI